MREDDFDVERCLNALQRGNQEMLAALFDHYRTAISGLGAEADLPRLLRRFELKLLEQTGYAMELKRDVGRDRPLCPDVRYRYDPERGPMEWLPGEGGFSVSGRTLLALAGDEDLDPEGSREAKELMRLVLARHLGDRPLKSRELFRTI